MGLWDGAFRPHNPEVAERKHGPWEPRNAAFGRFEDDEEDLPRPFPRIKITNEEGGQETIETMELVISHVHSRHRLLFELLGATGVRRSELLAFELRHLELDGERPFVRVRQRVRRRKGKGLVLDR